MSEEESAASDNDTQLVEAQDGPKLPGMLEELKGDNPTICGIDYYLIIYVASGLLALVMLFLYVVIDEPAIK